ncbi:molybdopterin-binding protein [Kushneria aurantia]|uniref:Molybdopterin-binding protein n=1 Tax=Kushneria aurantia TaxID=504092 RepID=A0ABV6G3K5_9GAMM|nr:molybdopterin-binding protein [Kushneria aurantia]
MSERNEDGLSRRALLQRAALGAAALGLSGCDRLSQNDALLNLLGGAQALNMTAQRLLAGDALAIEYPASMISPVFRPNGSTDPQTDLYRGYLANDFTDWRLEIGGLVDNPLSLSLAEIRAMPARTQITRHDCVEGWSVIGQWTGPVLGDVLARAGVQPQARYVVFHCMDQLNGRNFYYESIDMVAARHPQTLLAHSLNGEAVPVANGAPLRLRVERQLGYKMAKYLHGITLVEHFDDIQGGKGGYWEDRGYTWYAGI